MFSMQMEPLFVVCLYVLAAFPCVYAETCAKVMEVCSTNKDGNFCRDLRLSHKLIEIGQACGMAYGMGQCTPDCTNKITQVLRFDFGYRLLKCDCSHTIGSYQQNVNCQLEQEKIQICQHVIESWCSDATGECTSNATCNEAKEQFQQSCNECSRECDDSLRRLYTARTSDKLLCDCDGLFNSSNICESSRNTMLGFCSTGLPTEQPRTTHSLDTVTMGNENVTEQSVSAAATLSFLYHLVGLAITISISKLLIQF